MKEAETTISDYPAEKAKNMIAVASGKAGIGKTWFAVTLTHALSGMRQKTLLFDGDLGLANLSMQLGLSVDDTLSEVISQKKTLNQIVHKYDKANFDIIADRPGSPSLATVPIGRLQILGEDLSIMSSSYHKVIMDMGAGIEKSIRILSGMAGKIIVICNEASDSLIEAYDFIKIMHKQYPNANLSIVVNQANSLREGRRTYDTLLKSCDKFLGLHPDLLGIIRRDTRVRDSIRNQTSILSRYPTSEAAEDVINIAGKLI